MNRIRKKLAFNDLCSDYIMRELECRNCSAALRMNSRFGRSIAFESNGRMPVHH